jgi:hypothetical protein
MKYDPGMTLTLDLAADLEHQVLQEARRRGLDAESFALDLLRESLASKGSSESALSEGELLEEINRGFPSGVWARYRELVARRQAETLTAEEHTELIALIDRIELGNAHRIECLAELATRRQVPLRVLMAEMGIQPADA